MSKLTIVAQAFYGNRTKTEVELNNLDRFILGYTDNSLNIGDRKINRTIVRIPSTDNIVIVYNKYQEEQELQRKEELLKEDNYVLKPTVIIPENNFKLYSRCIVCRIDKDGNLQSLKDGDVQKFLEYLTK